MTHKKIAQAANVSLSTVSKALSGSKEISDELSQKIIKIAIETGYFEEKSKRKLEYIKNHAVSVAIVCPEIISLAYAHEITALKNEIESRGGFVSIYVYDFDDNKMNKILEMIIIRNSADGIILFSVPDDSVKSCVPIVCISNEPSSNYDTICCNIDSCIFDMVKYLKNLGHCDIAFVGETYTMSKLSAFKECMKTLNLPYDENNTYVINERFENIGYIAAEQILAKEKIPTAIVCAYDEIAIAIIHCFSENGINIPEQVSIIGINDIPMAAYAQIPLTTISTFQEEQSSLAVNLLYDKIFNSSKAVKHITVNHKLIERKSTAAPVRSKA